MISYFINVRRREKVCVPLILFGNFFMSRSKEDTTGCVFYKTSSFFETSLLYKDP